MAEELVVLLDAAGRPNGQALKSTVHGRDTPLHLAFSCHVRDQSGRLLVTRRALTKVAWPGVWTNAFCGHPAPGEPVGDAVVRRARDELGVRIRDLRLVLPDFRYRATDPSGVVEHELCPVYLADVGTAVHPAATEVMDFAWVPVQDLVEAVARAPFAFSPWLTLQLPALGGALRR